MGILSHSKVYLCGQVESDLDNAYSWRSSMADILKSINKEIIVWDPLITPSWVPDFCQDPKAFDKSILHHNLFNIDPDHESRKRIVNTNLIVRKVCHKLASTCDWMIARLSDKFTWGSIQELEIAIQRGIPIFIIYADRPLSVYGSTGILENRVGDPIISHLDDYVFNDVNKMYDIIRELDSKGPASDLIKNDPFKWSFITYTDGEDYAPIA